MVNEARLDAEQAIRLRPLCPKGWMLKGRLLEHEAALEHAAEAFDMASKVQVKVCVCVLYVRCVCVCVVCQVCVCVCCMSGVCVCVV
jgi:hypothetical protein